MALETEIGSTFLDLFYHEMKDQVLANSNKLNLFTLKVSNNSFAYKELIESLSNSLYHFALSKAEIKLLKESDKLATLIKRAKDKLIEYCEKNAEESSQKGTNNEGGELGEILLYCLLESHLNAPKILTKLEIKTSGQMYVHGADGVHLLKITEKDYQLIFGESKLYTSLKDGIYEAFTSISTLLENKGKKIDFEINLVDSQLVKESCSDEMYNFLKKIIFPNANEDETNMDHSFAIFLGFNIEITDEEKSKSNSEFRTYIRGKIKTEVSKSISSIDFQIKKAQYKGYSFYVYVVPFSDLIKERLEIIKGVKES